MLFQCDEKSALSRYPQLEAFQARTGEAPKFYKARKNIFDGQINSLHFCCSVARMSCERPVDVQAFNPKVSHFSNLKNNF
jgi:hypothetical protein